MSQDPDRRLKEHNSRMVKSTKAFVPWVKVFQKEVGNRQSAREVEKYYKSPSGRRFIKNYIQSHKNSF